jgi:hypothetical protein
MRLTRALLTRMSRFRFAHNADVGQPVRDRPLLMRLLSLPLLLLSFRAKVCLGPQRHRGC